MAGKPPSTIATRTPRRNYNKVGSGRSQVGGAAGGFLVVRESGIFSFIKTTRDRLAELWFYGTLMGKAA
jgi:hypothetical protein